MQINSNLYHYGTAYTSVQKKTQMESGGYDKSPSCYLVKNEL